MAPVLGALFAVLIGLLAIRPYISYQRQSFENIKVANTASQFRQILDAAQSYVQNNCVSGNGSSSASGCSPLPYTVPFTQLQPYLPADTLQINPYGQQWNVLVSQANTGNNSVGGLQVAVYSSDPSAGVSKQIPQVQAPEIAAETGAEGGFIPYPNQYGNTTPANTALGAYGHWQLTLTGALQSIGAGHLLGVLYFNPNGILDNDFLYRVKAPGDTNGTLNTMAANLNMGGNMITNASSVTASSAVVGGNNATNSATLAANPQGAGLTVSGEGPAGSNISDDSTTQSTLAIDGTSSSSLTIGTDGSISNAPTSASSSLSVSSTGKAALSVNGAGGSTISVGATSTNSNSNSLLTLTSAGGIVGQPCSPLNAIGPGTSGPVACETSPGGTLEWESMTGGSFTTVTDVSSSVWPQDTLIQNTTNKAWFITTHCNKSASTWGGNFSIELDVYNSAQSLISDARNQVGFADPLSIATMFVIPTGSIIVPPQYYFSYHTSGGWWGIQQAGCGFMVAQ